LTKVVLRERNNEKKAGKKATSVPFSFMTGVFLLPIVALCIILYHVTNSMTYLFIPIILSLLMVMANRGFLEFIYNNKGSNFLVRSVIFLHIDYIFVDLGIIYGVLTYFCGRRY
jgi:hypothetical protein